MNVPKGAIWQALRTDALDTIPSGTRVFHSSAQTLSGWFSRGYFSVAHPVPHGLALVTSEKEIGISLLSEAEHLLDHASEHQVVVYRGTRTGSQWSPAWLVVTVYYWGFFLALALTRLVGRTIWFLDHDAVRLINGLAPPGSPKIRPGAFLLQCRLRLNVTEREVELTSRKDRLHDAVWRHLWRYLNALFKAHGPATSNSLEYRLFSCLEEASRILGEDWPSLLRNAVNYRPGLGYQAVQRLDRLEIHRAIREISEMDFDTIVPLLETELTRTRIIGSVSTRPSGVVRMLLHSVLLLNGLCRELHADMVDRQGLDSRWGKARMRYLQTSGVAAGRGEWPYGATE